MVEYEADDALAAAAVQAASDPRVTQVRICTPDKDLAQCVSGTRIVQEDRLRRAVRDEAGVVAKFGVPPLSIPDYLALVGDSSDGYPGIPGWGAKSAAAVLAKFQHINQIPADWRSWGVNVARPGALSIALEKDRPLAMLFRDLGHGKVKVSFRSVAGVNVNVLAKRFGGGGHARASGAMIAGGPKDVESRVLGEARHLLETGALAD